MSDQPGVSNESRDNPTQDDVHSGVRSQTHATSETRDAATLPEPSKEDLQKPSTEKEPDEEPEASEQQHEPEPSHQAVGIGVIETPER